MFTAAASFITAKKWKTAQLGEWVNTMWCCNAVQ